MHALKTIINDDRGFRAGLGPHGIVVAILLFGVLLAVVSPAAFRFVEKAKYEEVVVDIKFIEQALIRYYTDVGTLAPLDDIHGFSPSATGPTHQHFLTGDGWAGWDGPYLQRVPIGSTYGGTYDIDVFNSSQASIDLGTKSQMGQNYQEVLEAVDSILDDDDDTTRGRVWGDSNGIHVGFNYVRN